MAAKKSAPSTGSATAAAVAAVKAVSARKARRSRTVTWASIAAAIAVLTVIVIAVVSKSNQAAPPASPSPSASASASATASPDDAIADLQVFTDLAAGHTANLPEPETVDGKRLPPVGGDHDEAWQTCAVYDAPVGTWYAVHSMEHGAVWVTYNPDLSADDVAVLAALVEGNEYALLSPFTDLADPVVLTAWGLRLELDSVTDPRIAAFLAQYSSGPQTPEPGAPCLGGIDATL